MSFTRKTTDSGIDSFTLPYDPNEDIDLSDLQFTDGLKLDELSKEFDASQTTFKNLISELEPLLLNLHASPRQPTPIPAIRISGAPTMDDHPEKDLDMVFNRFQNNLRLIVSESAINVPVLNKLIDTLKNKLDESQLAKIIKKGISTAKACKSLMKQSGEDLTLLISSEEEGFDCTLPIDLINDVKQANTKTVSAISLLIAQLPKVVKDFNSAKTEVSKLNSCHV